MGTKTLVSGLMVAGLWLLASSGTAMAGAAEGKAAFAAKKCINCHSLGAEKGAMAKLGGPLDGVGGKRDAAWLKAYLSDPKSKIPDAKMPKASYGGQELDDIVSYLGTLK